MNTTPAARITIDRFLLGQFAKEEYDQFLRLCRKNRDMQQQLYAESAVEAAFFSQQWLESAPLIREGIGACFASPAQETATGSEPAPDGTCVPDDATLSPDTWDRVLDASFIQAANRTPAPAFFLPFFATGIRKAATFLCLVIIIVSGLLIYSFRTSTASRTASKAYPLPYHYAVNHIPGSAADTGPDGHDTIAAVSAFDPIEEYREPNPAKTAIISIPGEKSGVVYLSRNSGFLAEKNTGITVITNNDSIVTLSMKSGSAVFTVEKRRYRRFAVITPHAEVRVAGTVFRIAVCPEKTNVTVSEGSVLVTTAQGTQEKLTLTQGTYAVVCGEMLVKDLLEKSRTLTLRENLLKSYLHYMQQSHLDRFSLDTTFTVLRQMELRFLDSLMNSADPLINAQLMHYKTAHNAETSHRHEKAVRHFMQIYRERQHESIAQFALIRACQLGVRHLPVERAIELCETYLSDFPGGFALQEILILSIRTSLALQDFDKAAPYMIRFLTLFPAAGYADHIAFNLAQVYRQKADDFSAAMTWYEFVIEHCPHSLYHEDATYWAGWCLVQQQLNKRDNRFFTDYLKNYPDGNWRRIISERYYTVSVPD